METIISNLVTRFERGALTRRELIQALAMLAAASGTAAAVPQEAGFKGVKIDHVSIHEFAALHRFLQEDIWFLRRERG